MKLRHALMKLCGIAPAAPAPDWKLPLRRFGYIVYESYGVWHWYHPPSGARSGRYTTERDAWFAAKLDYDSLTEAS